MSRGRAALLLAALSLVACRRTELVGSLGCSTSADCAPPDSICGVDGRCVPGCAQDPNGCVAGAVCAPTTGECSGAPACSEDDDCDPPATVCNPSAHVCVGGCTLAGCAEGLRCKPTSGHCCDPADPECPLPDPGMSCNSDAECPGAPTTICSAGACVPGCATTGCTTPFACDGSTGHCAVPACTRDLDCDSGSYCTSTQQCAVLAFAGPIACAGGTKVKYACVLEATPAAFAACAGAPGPSACPYCIDGSCLRPGLCTWTSDCHRGDDCFGGLCRALEPECPQLVSISDVFQGTYAAGKEVCVRDTVMAVRSGYDGMNEIRLGTTPYLYVKVPPMYVAAGVRLPAPGEMVTLHGTVRWNAAHHDHELLPVDWVSPP